MSRDHKKSQDARGHGATTSAVQEVTPTTLGCPPLCRVAENGARETATGKMSSAALTSRELQETRDMVME